MSTLYTCIDPEEGLFLVYKYVSSGSLERHLHGKKRNAKGFASLSWSARYKVAIGMAEAIAYLHNGTEKCIVHRDIKPSNILLSSKKRPKLCDFGLATWTPAPSVPFLCKTVKGTFGYLAPEYFQHGKVSDKTDVYAFGVVLSELITGRKPIESSRPPGEENLVQWDMEFECVPTCLTERVMNFLNDVREELRSSMAKDEATLKNETIMNAENQDSMNTSATTGQEILLASPLSSISLDFQKKFTLSKHDLLNDDCCQLSHHSDCTFTYGGLFTQCSALSPIVPAASVKLELFSEKESFYKGRINFYQGP